MIDTVRSRFLSSSASTTYGPAKTRATYGHDGTATFRVSSTDPPRGKVRIRGSQEEERDQSRMSEHVDYTDITYPVRNSYALHIVFPN